MTILTEGKRSFFINTPAILISDTKDVASNWASNYIYNNEAIKWVLAKYVEADKANSNGQMWALEDLRMKFPTVNNSPMNIDHHQREIVGTWVGSELLYPLDEQADVFNPYVEVLGAFWSAYFPEVLSKVEEAFDMGALHVSMECSGDSVTCAGTEVACGETFEYDGPFSDRYCFVPDTLVLMADGTRKSIQNIKIGDLVVTHTGAVKPVTRLFVHNHDGSVLTIKYTGSSEGVTMTANHPVRTFRYDGKKTQTRALLTEDAWQWVAAGDLFVKDRVELGYPTLESPFTIDLLKLFPDQLIEIEGRVYRKSASGLGRQSKYGLDRYIELSESLMVLAGLYTAEGSVWADNKIVSWALHQNEIEAHEALRVALDKLNAGELHIYKSKKSQGVQCRVSNTPLALLLQYLCGKGSRLKSLASEIMIAPVYYQKVFLDWYIYGDGHFSDANGSTQIRTTSAMLARNINDMLLRSGIIPTIYHRLRQPGGPDNRLLERDIWQIQFNDSSQTIFHKNGFTSRPIKSIEETYYAGPVYNFEVEDDHSYIVENLVVHNCEHIKERASFRQINNPHFLGGALILPPNKPGWKSASVTDLSETEVEKVMTDIEKSHPQLNEEQWRAMSESIVYRATLDKFFKVS